MGPQSSIDCHAARASAPGSLPGTLSLGNNRMLLPISFLPLQCPLEESLSSDRTALKGHKLCVCRTSGTNPCHPSTAAHEQGLQSCETMPQCQCLPYNDSSHTSLPTPRHPEDSSSCSSLILSSWAAAVGVEVIALLVCAVFSTVLHERQQLLLKSGFRCMILPALA